MAKLCTSRECVRPSALPGAPARRRKSEDVQQKICHQARAINLSCDTHLLGEELS
jgi:hypothetical protein